MLQNHGYHSCCHCFLFSYYEGETFCKLLIIAENTFTDCSLLLRLRTPRPKFHGKTFAYNHKTVNAKFAKVFSVESFPLCGTFVYSNCKPVDMYRLANYLCTQECIRTDGMSKRVTPIEAHSLVKIIELY